MSTGQEYRSGDEIFIEYQYEIGEKVEAFNFTITYHNTVVPNTNPETYTVEDADFTLSPATKEGYIFKGWYDNPDFQGIPITEITTGTIGDIDLYAKFVEETITNIVSNTNDQVNFYPNPCNDFINLTNPNNQTISIFSINGTLKLTSINQKLM